MTESVICRVGIDEAGYGPTLGPLVIASSAVEWNEQFEQSKAVDLWSILDPVCRKERKGQRSSIWVYDSKVIKSGSKGLEELESAILAFYCLDHPWPANMTELLSELGVDRADFENLPWYDSLWDSKLPKFAWKQDILEKSGRLAKALDANGMHWRGLQARVYNARVFNAGVTHYDNKATFHVKNIADLIAHNSETNKNAEAASSSFDFRCDKLGGRSQYHGVLKTLFPKTLIKIIEQGRKISRYSLPHGTGQIAVQFQQKADQQNFLTALSSMLCKYLREVFVAEFNAYFLKQKPELKKTAGYPQDAKRYLADVEELDFVKDDFIRCR